MPPGGRAAGDGYRIFRPVNMGAAPPVLAGLRAVRSGFSAVQRAARASSQMAACCPRPLGARRRRRPACSGPRRLSEPAVFGQPAVHAFGSRKLGSSPRTNAECQVCARPVTARAGTIVQCRKHRQFCRRAFGRFAARGN